jgi:hypothetical protein
METITNNNREAIQATIDKVTENIDTLLSIYNGQIIGASIIITAIEKENVDPKTFIGNFYFSAKSGIPDEFKQFLHDYCTRLCAEKLKLESQL